MKKSPVAMWTSEWVQIGTETRINQQTKEIETVPRYIAQGKFNSNWQNYGKYKLQTKDKQ